MDFIDVCVYDNFLAGIPNEKSYSEIIKKSITPAKTTSVTDDDVKLYIENSRNVDVLYTNRVVSGALTLQDDYYTYGDLIMMEDIDLNGYTMTINGDFILNGGALTINGGTLNVNGNFAIEEVTHIDSKTNEKVIDHCGYLHMKYANDTVNVYGNFTVKCAYAHDSSDLANGTVFIGGNFYQLNGDSGNFKPSNNFLLTFDGVGTHEIYFEGEESYLGGVKTINGADLKFTGNFRGFTLADDLTLTGDTMFNHYMLDLNGHTLTINGSLTQIGGCMNINSGTLNVNGDYTITSTTHYDAKEGKTILDVSGRIYMQYANDAVNVKGDFHTYSEHTCSNSTSNNYLNRGTLTIYGDFYQHSGDEIGEGEGANFVPGNDFNLVISGAGVHEIYFDSISSKMTGIKEENGATIKITGVFSGFTLSNDIIITGDLPLNGYPMDLNGHTLTINGDLNHDMSVMNVNSGTLNVNGDYNILSKSHYDAKTDETVLDGSGRLYMQYANDVVNIKGDFHTYSEHTCSNSTSYNYLNRGTLTIYGDFYQHSGDRVDDGNPNNFVPSDNFNIIFTGDKTHIFSSDSKETKTGIITLNKGEKVTFKGNLAGLENVENCSFMSDGTIVSIDKNTISAAYPGTGKVTIVNPSNTKATINVTITDSIKGDVNCDGKVTVADAVLLQKWLLANPSAFLPCWKTADLCEDNQIDVFDLCLLKRMLVENR